MVFSKPAPDSPPPVHWKCWRHAWVRACWYAQPWWQDTGPLRAIYREAERQRALGRDVCVDHLVPLRHPHVCGLHVPANLRVVTDHENAQKSNHYWPDMWAEQQALPLPELGPHQRALV